MDQSALAQALNQLSTDLGAASDELTKATDEINKKIADLTAAVGNSGTTTPEVDAALAAVQTAASKLTGIAKTVDDIVPDPVEPPPPTT